MTLCSSPLTKIAAVLCLSVLWCGTAVQAQPPAGFLGIGVRDVSPEEVKLFNLPSEDGALITVVKPDSPADRAGLRLGDVIVRFAGKPVKDARSLVDDVTATAAGHRVPIQLWRAGHVETVSLTTASRPPLDRSENAPPLQMPPADIPEPMLVWRNTVLGTECEPLSAQLAAYFGVQNGILVRFVVPGSLAGEAGLRAGDVIVAAADHVITSSRDLTVAIGQATSIDSRVLTIAIVRAQKAMTLRIRIAE